MKLHTIVWTVLGLTALSACQGTPPHGDLDGRIYQVSLEADGEEPAPDGLLFAAGGFESTACRGFGFSRTSYTTSEAGGLVRFEAEAVNAGGARTRWNGSIHGASVEGTMDLVDAGGSIKRYRFGGELAHGVLDGRAFDVVLRDEGGEGKDDDELVFSGGGFESKACTPYGFCPSTYEAAASGAGGAVTFSSTTTSAENGTILWTGEVEGGRIHGRMTWTPASGSVSNRTFEGSERHGE